MQFLAHTDTSTWHPRFPLTTRHTSSAKFMPAQPPQASMRKCFPFVLELDLVFCLKIHLFFSCPLPSLLSLEWFTLPRHSIFPTPPPKSEAPGLIVAHSLQHAPTHGPITDHFRARQPRLSTDSFQGTHCRLPAGCSTCARERGCHRPLGSHSKQLREFPSPAGAALVTRSQTPAGVG